MKYPEEIYRNPIKGYKAGKAEQSNPLAGYANLTAAILAGEPIDWERLDGREVQCVKSGAETLKGKLERDNLMPSDFASGWQVYGVGLVYITAWHGRDGWTLWVEGEIPLVRKTADQLEVGTYFLGNCRLVKEGVMYVGRAEESVEKAIRFVPSMTVSQFGAEDWGVLEEYGPFQKPEEKK